MKPNKLIYDKAPRKGFEKESEGLAKEIAALEKEPPFDFTGTVIVHGSGAGKFEFYVQDGNLMRGVVTSDHHLLKQFQLMREIIYWRTEEARLDRELKTQVSINEELKVQLAEPQKGWIKGLFTR